MTRRAPIRAAPDARPATRPMAPGTVERGAAGERGTAGGPARPRATAHPGPMRGRDEGRPTNRPDFRVRTVSGGAGGRDNKRPAAEGTAAYLDARSPGSPRAPGHVRDRRGERPAAGVTRALDRGAGGGTAAAGDMAP